MDKQQQQPDHQPESEYNVAVDLPNGPDEKFAPSGWKPPRKFSKKALLGFGLVAAVVVIGLVGWKILGSHKTAITSTDQQARANNQPQPAKTTEVPDVSATKTYKNDRMGLTLTHPDSWTITETTDNGVRVESPSFTYQVTGNTTTEGVFRIYVRLGARPQDQKVIGRGLAIQPSDKLTYLNPLPGQRKDTFLTAFGLDNTDNFGFFMIAGNFNLKKGESLGPTYGKETDAFIIGGGYSAKSLTDDLATNSVPISYYNQSKAYKQAIDILKSLQLH